MPYAWTGKQFSGENRVVFNFHWKNNKIYYICKRKTFRVCIRFVIIIHKYFYKNIRD